MPTCPARSIGSRRVQGRCTSHRIRMSGRGSRHLSRKSSPVSVPVASIAVADRHRSTPPYASIARSAVLESAIAGRASGAETTPRGCGLKLCMFRPLDRPLERGWPGRIEGDRVIQLAAQTLQSFFTGGGGAREHAEYPLDEVRLLAPVLHPPSLRDFYAFEEHVRNARMTPVPSEWYEIPVFYFSNPAAIYGPGEDVPHPDGTEQLDYE